MARFWREISSRYNLLGVRCENCGKVMFPAREICPNCRRDSLGKLAPHKLSPEGKVVTYTVIHEAQKGFEKLVPYIMGIVEMDDGVKLTSQIVDCEPEDVEIGTRVKAVFRRINEDGAEGAIYYGYKFALANQAY